MIATTEAPQHWMLIEEDAPIDVPLDTPVLLAWWNDWTGAWEMEVGHAGSERGGWRHGRATHWRPTPPPPATIARKNDDGALLIGGDPAEPRDDSDLSMHDGSDV